jgi:hypothetical protein
MSECLGRGRVFATRRETRDAFARRETRTRAPMSHQDWKEITIGKRAPAGGGSGVSAKAAKDPKAVAAVRRAHVPWCGVVWCGVVWCGVT